MNTSTTSDKALENIEAVDLSKTQLLPGKRYEFTIRSLLLGTTVLAGACWAAHERIELSEDRCETYLREKVNQEIDESLASRMIERERQSLKSNLIEIGSATAAAAIIYGMTMVHWHSMRLKNKE